MAIAINPNQKRPYTLVADLAQPEEARTKWIFRWPTFEQNAEIRDQSAFDRDTREFRLHTVRAKLRALKLLLDNVENFRDAKGEVIPFEKGADGYVSDAFLARISPHDQVELGDFALDGMELTADEKKA